MRISPPIAVLTMIGVVLAGAAWLVPAPREPTQMSVVISKAAYQKLEMWAKKHGSVNGGEPTVARAIEELANVTERDRAATASQPKTGAGQLPPSIRSGEGPQ